MTKQRESEQAYDPSLVVQVEQRRQKPAHDDRPLTGERVRIEVKDQAGRVGTIARVMPERFFVAIDALKGSVAGPYTALEFTRLEPRKSPQILEEQRNAARLHERAAIVAWLRGSDSDVVLGYADSIENGAHVEQRCAEPLPAKGIPARGGSVGSTEVDSAQNPSGGLPAYSASHASGEGKNR